MHNDTPLGTTMHLKELDRQVVLGRHRLQAGSQTGFPLATVWAVTIALLRRLPVVAAPRRVVSRG